MKHSKAILITLCVCLILIGAPDKAQAAQDSGNCGTNLYWSMEYNGTLNLIGTGAIPNYYVVNNTNQAPWASYIKQIKTVYISSGVTRIGAGAFFGCSELTSVTIPNSVTGILGDAFSGCAKLSSVTIPEGVTLIDRAAFQGCSALIRVTIPSSVTSIISGAFSDCNKLTSIEVAQNNAYYCSNNGVLFDKLNTKLVQYPGGAGIEYEVPNGVASIEDYAFSGCSRLTSITLPDSMKEIGFYAFSGCSGLKRITLPNSLTGILNFAFSDCSGLTSITLPSSLTSICAYTFSGCSGLTGITIPDSVTGIGDYAFNSCISLASLTIPENVTSIGENAFSDCNELTDITFNMSTVPNCFTGNTIIKNVTLSESVTSIGDGAFRGCSGLTDITIPNSVTSIGSYAFAGCRGLTDITIPSSVTSIGSYAFADCRGLTNITIPSSVTSISSYAFSDCRGLTDITIPSSVTGIGSYAFSGCSGLTDITLPNSVTSIDSYAFSDCSGLTSITLSDSVTGIGKGAFSHCSSLFSVVIPRSVTSIGDYAFSNCSSLRNVYYLGSSWYSINMGNSSMPSNTRVHSSCIIANDWVYTMSKTNAAVINYIGTDTEISIPSNIDGITVTSIYDNAFFSMNDLKSVTIPDSVTSIGSYAFSGYGSMGDKMITIGNSLASIGSNAFSGLSADSIIYLPQESAATIGSSFKGTVYRDYERFFEAAFSKGYLDINEYSEGTITILNGQSMMPKWYKRGEEQMILFGSDIGYDFSAAALDGVLLEGKSFTVPDKESFTLEIVLTKKYDATSGGFFDDGLNWCLTSDNTLVFYGDGKIGDYSNSSRAPWYSSRSRIKAVSFNGTVRAIGAYAFDSCTALTELTVPGTVESIGDYAFKGCTGLTKVILEDGVKRIGTGAFNNCNKLLWNYGYLVLPSTLESDSDFHNFTDSDFFYISGGSTDAFAKTEGGCIWHPITSLDDIAVLSVESLDGGTVKLSKMFAAPGDKIMLTFVPAPGYKFSTFRLLTVSGPKAIDSEYTVPSGGSYEFGAKIIAPVGPVVSGRLGSTNTYYWYADGEAHIYGSGATPNYSITYTSGSYYNESPLRKGSCSYNKIVIEDGVTEIGTALFYNVSGVKEIQFGKDLTRIGTYAFSKLYDLESVTLPEGLRTIQDGAFDSDYALRTLVIPGSVTSVGSSSTGAFSGTALRSAGPIGSGCDIQFGWTESIPDYAFLNAGGSVIAGRGLEKVIIPEGVQSIGTKAFAWWDSGSDLKSLYLPDSLTTVGADAFLNCKALKTAGGTGDNVRLPVNETFNGGIISAFPGLERVSVPEETKTIGEKAFSGCAGITSVSLPSGLSAIGASAFENCSGLGSINVPEGVTELKSNTFEGCTGLKRIFISKNLNSVAMSTFNGCTALQDVFFDGTEDEWKAITISPLLNDPLLNAGIHYAGDPFIPYSASFASADHDGNGVAAVLVFDWCDIDLDVYVAVYQDGRMIQAAAVRVSEGAGSSTVSVPVEGLSGEYRIKAFFLDTVNHAPLGKSTEMTLPAG